MTSMPGSGNSMVKRDTVPGTAYAYNTANRELLMLYSRPPLIGKSNSLDPTLMLTQSVPNAWLYRIQPASVKVNPSSYTLGRKRHETLSLTEPIPPKTSAPSLMRPDRKSTRLNSSHSQISYAVFC